MEEEDDADDRDDRRLLEELLLQRLDRPLDQPRAIVDGNDLHPLRQPCLEGLEFPLHVPDRLQGVLPEPHHHDAALDVPLPVQVGVFRLRDFPELLLGIHDLRDDVGRGEIDRGPHGTAPQGVQIGPQFHFLLPEKDQHVSHPGDLHLGLEQVLLGRLSHRIPGVCDREKLAQERPVLLRQAGHLPVLEQEEEILLHLEPDHVPHALHPVRRLHRFETGQLLLQGKFPRKRDRLGEPDVPGGHRLLVGGEVVHREVGVRKRQHRVGKRPRGEHTLLFGLRRESEGEQIRVPFDRLAHERAEKIRLPRLLFRPKRRGNGQQETQQKGCPPPFSHDGHPAFPPRNVFLEFGSPPPTAT